MWKNKKGAKKSGLGLSVWVPLNFPAPVELSEDSVIPDITLNNIYELKSLLIVDEKPKSLMPQDQDQQSNGFGGSLKSLLSTCPNAGCFSSSKAQDKRPKRFLSQPEIENSNSNASNGSDGSWYGKQHLNFFEISTKNLQVVFFNGIVWFY